MRRTSVFVGTTNEDEFLTDATGLTDKLRDHERLDPWHGAIAEYVAGKAQVCTNEVLGSNCLNIARERQGRAEEMRVTSTLKLLGFRASRVGPKRERIWVRD